MDISLLKEITQYRQPKPEGSYQDFSVLVPLLQVQDELHLLFEVRAESLKTQPGEICFPGGKIEPGESPVDCARRETCEELGIPEDEIEIFGPLDYVVTPYNFILYPYLGALPSAALDAIPFNVQEVGEIFTVPLHFFFQGPQEYIINVEMAPHTSFPYEKIQGGKNYNWKKGYSTVHFYEYGNYIIWGMTARIIKNLVEIILKEK
ncbi:MAG: CoA pyrophosphatase [Thermotaleaceae bacterium]